MRKTFVFTALLAVLTVLWISPAQAGQKYTPYNGRWSASWITHPEATSCEYAVVLFRNTFELPADPEKFLIHITADNRYRLFVNGEFAGMGPQGSDIRHWRYESLDIAPWLRAGKNTLAVEVVNWGDNRAFGLISLKTGLLIQGDGQTEEVVNTNDKSWKSYINPAYKPNQVNWMYAVDVLGGFYAANPCDILEAEKYPWGWQTPGFDDSRWPVSRWLASAAAWGGSFGWILSPRNTPPVVFNRERFDKVIRYEGVKNTPGFISGTQPQLIPANTRAYFLLDNKVLTSGYPELLMSGGKGAKVRIRYAENLFDAQKEKGNRNQTDGKDLIGINDIYFADGGADRVFRPLYFKSYRFVKIEIETANEPLIIKDYYTLATSAAGPMVARFVSGNALLDSVLQMCWQTNKICVHENLLSDAYYEQMQYVGDSKVHNLTQLILTGQDDFFRNSLEQFNFSRLTDGQITSCYPLKGTFVHPTFTLIWIDMVHDYMMYRNDPEFVRQFLPAIEFSLHWYEGRRNANGLLGKTNWAYFVDWYTGEGRKGVAPGSEDGNSAVITLQYALSLDNTADIFDFFGETDKATEYRSMAAQVKADVMNNCYDPQRGLLAENPDKTFFDQRGNLIGVLTDAIPASEQARVMEKVMTDTSLSQAELFFRFRMFEALKKTGQMQYFFKALEPWQKLLAQGLTTTPETFINPRSEAHPWATAPAISMFHDLAGISPAEPGFKTVQIAPQFIGVTSIDVVYPHYLGNIECKLVKTKRGISGEITLPEGLTGILKWGGKSLDIKSGRQMVNI